MYGKILKLNSASETHNVSRSIPAYTVPFKKAKKTTNSPKFKNRDQLRKEYKDRHVTYIRMRSIYILTCVKYYVAIKMIMTNDSHLHFLERLKYAI